MTTSSSRSSSPTSSVSSSELYVPVHKRTSSGSIASSISSRSFSSSASTSSYSDSSISPPHAPAFVYSRDILLNLANSPLARLPQTQRDTLRGEVPEVISNRKQRKAIEYHNHVHAVQTSALRVPSPTTRSNDNRRKHNKERSSKPAAV